jgi:hypothetical protein
MSETHKDAPAESTAAASGEPDATKDSRDVGKRHSRWAGVSKLNAVLATILAIIGTVIAYEQAHLAQVTNRAAEQQAAATATAANQQSLVSLVGDIAALSKSLPQTPGDEVAPVHQEMAVEAEQGLALVKELGGRVPAIDKFELGVGFEPSGDLQLALISFTAAGTDRAGKEANEPIYRSKALRAAAAILYSLGGQAHANAARKDNLLAYDAFEGQRDVTRSQADQNHELVDLWDTFWSAGSECNAAAPDAAKELREATQIIKQDPASEDAGVGDGLREASNELQSCRAGRPDLLPLPYVPVS